MKVEKKSELIGRGGFYRRPVGEGGWNSKWKKQMAFRGGIGKVEKVD
jgi:hypothetical protein